MLLGAPGAGVTSVGAVLAGRLGVDLTDLAGAVARRLGVDEALALVSVGEERYRAVEQEEALAALGDLRSRPGVVALGSGCLTDPQVREALEAARAAGGLVVAMTAPVRVLATRNGLDAPRSVALGTVRHEFGLMAAERERLCQGLAGLTVDTATTTAQDTAATVLEALAAPAAPRG